MQRHVKQPCDLSAGLGTLEIQRLHEATCRTRGGRRRCHGRCILIAAIALLHVFSVRTSPTVLFLFIMFIFLVSYLQVFDSMNFDFPLPLGAFWSERTCIRHRWIWLKIIDTPNRWFPTKYDHSCGSFGTIILSHCQVSLVAHTRCQLISLACCRRLVAHQHAHLRGHWEWCLGNSQPLPHAATKLPQSYSHNEKFSKKTVSNMLSVAHLFWCFDFYDWLVVWNIVYFPIYWG